MLVSQYALRAMLCAGFEQVIGGNLGMSKCKVVLEKLVWCVRIIRQPASQLAHALELLNTELAGKDRVLGYKITCPAPTIGSKQRPLQMLVFVAPAPAVDEEAFKLGVGPRDDFMPVCCSF